MLKTQTTETHKRDIRILPHLLFVSSGNEHTWHHVGIVQRTKTKNHIDLQYYYPPVVDSPTTAIHHGQLTPRPFISVTSSATG